MSQASIQAVVVARFPLGNIVATCGISDLIHQGAINPMAYLARHVRGDWGDLCDEDRLLNERSVGGRGRLMSSYKITEQITLWIITECDRSVTTLLLPSEY